ncbi:MAG: ribonuclease HII [Oscillospiraceae bacterium]|nr:ribonuclease HII [Oscillospiraceae bacterium]
MKQSTLDRRKALWTFDQQYSEKYGVICGVDEAGRGPLAGDVYAAAVILPEDCNIEGLDDSKKLSGKRREILFKKIQEKAVCYCIASASVAEIEKYNILRASLLAMKRAVEGLQMTPDYALIDGNQLPALEIPMACIVKGDALSASIAAASVLAKVARDQYMTQQAKLYPGYLFEKHKGYGTKEHRNLLLQNGACPIHRKSFLKKILP